jgi:hypothetical protein
MRLVSIVGAVLLAGVAEAAGPPAPSPQGARWLKGDQATRVAMIERQFRGFDMAMAETGYRYTELYWAGKDRNWGYAQYQLAKMQKAITNGLERRPKRAESAKILEPPVNAVRAAIEEKSPSSFKASFASLTEACNQCHVMERVPFARVVYPSVRLSPVRLSGSVTPKK